MATPSPNSYVFTPGVTLYAGMTTPSGGTTLTTITLANTSATEQAAGFVSPMFGLPLKQGDVPAGQYPAFFLADNTPVPATIHSVTSWPDGSMKWCGVFLRVPTTVAGSGTLAITVKNGGSAPGSSARALSDFTAANLSVELTGVTNLSGVWTAMLNDAIANGTAVQIADGPAGAIWRVLGDFKQSGSAHGQLVCWHYIAALQNASGGLQGIRYLGRPAQPWTNVTSPAPALRTFTGRLVSGSSTVRTLQGIQTGEVVSNNITLPHYASFYTCGVDGTWDYFQSGGSAASDCTVRVVFDKTYFTATKLIPPFNLSQTVTASPTVSYYATCKGLAQERDMGSTGPRIEIGVLPGWQPKHLILQTANEERGTRVSGLAAGSWRTCLRQSTTGQIPPVVAIQASYTGLGTAQPTWLYRDEGNSVGVNPTPAGWLWEGEFEPSHRWSAAYYPYLITGEPQYLDMMVEVGGEMMARIIPGTSTWMVGSPVTNNLVGSWAGYRDPSIAGTVYKGAGLFFNANLYRVPAWGSREVAQPAAIYPDVCPAGTETRKYLRDILDSTYSGLNAYNAALPTSWRDAGLVSFLPDGTSDSDYESPWAFGYLSNSVCHQASILGTTGIVQFRQHMSKMYSSLHSISDIACMAAYRMSEWKGDGTRVESASDLVFTLVGNLTASVASNNFTITQAWNPTNGDVMAFTTASNIGSPNKPFAAATNNTRFYVVNASGKTFQLAATPGGSPITVTNNVTILAWLARLQNAAPLTSFEGANSPGAPISEIYSAIRHHEACGDSNVDPARIAQDANVAEAGVNFSEVPTNALAFSYPS